MAFHRFLKALRDGAPITLYGDGTQTRDFTYVGDAVRATVAAGQRGEAGGVYNIGGGARVAMNDVLAVMARCTGRQAAIRRADAGKGDMRDTWADTSRARRDLEFAPSVNLEEGISAEYAWLSATRS
jgi:UDP-glucose 4-epimerase